MPLNFAREEAMRAQGCKLVAGVDEVGRGPLAGPVMAAAVVIPDDGRVRDYLQKQANDSKQLSAARRMALREFIEEHCAFAVGTASVEEIDAVNIRNATFLAMRRALEGLQDMDAACGVVVDGNAKIPELKMAQQTLVGGDALELSVACASIVAKVRRDELMCELAKEHPQYGWDTNMGYGTAVHLRGLQEFGACVHHRVSFAPVREVVQRDAA